MKKIRNLSAFRGIIAAIAASALLAGCQGGEKEIRETGDTVQESEGASQADTESAGEGNQQNVDGTAEEELSQVETAPDLQPSPGTYSLQINKRYMEEYLDNGSPLFTASYPQITLLEKQGENNTSLKRALEHYNEKVQQETTALYAESLPYFQETYMEYPEDFYGYSYDRIINIERGDSRVLSFWEMEYNNSGGPHPNYYYSGYVFDVHSGEELKLTDVIADTDGLYDYTMEMLAERGTEEGFFEGYQQVVRNMIDGDERTDTLEWVLDSNGLTICFSPYVLAPYGMGTLEVTAGYEEQKELFREEYLKKGNKAVIPISAYDTVMVDVNGNKRKEEIKLGYGEAPDEYSWYDTLKVSVDETSVEQYLEGTFTEGFILRQENGQTWLYAEASGDNDYRSIHVFDLSGKEPAYKGSRLLGFGGIVPTDPEEFLMKERLFALSTYDARRAYRIGDDGLPEAAEDQYRMEFTGGIGEGEASYSRIRTKREVPAEPAAIPADTLVKFIRTDNKTYVDMEAEDGAVYRVYYENPVEWVSYTIDGTDLFEYFDGLIFAG